jgi:hypothetical protein
MSSSTPAWLTYVVTGYDSDPAVLKLIQELSLAPDSHPPYTLADGVLHLRDRIWLGNNKALQQCIMVALHTSAVGDHSGFPVTFSRLKKLFAWRGMKSDVKNFVANCSICAQAKPDHSRYPGLLSPLPVPTKSWQVISMDFIEGLACSSAANCLMVIVDRFSKFAHFLPLSHPFSAQQVTQVFLDNIYRLHGLPTHIINDRDHIFTSVFWCELFRLANMTLSMSSAYHSQTDGQTERVNQCLETYLQCFVHSCPRQWVKWIPLVEFWYNTSLHSFINGMPFEVLYSHPPRYFGLSASLVSSAPKVEPLISERATMLASMRHHLHRSHQRMKVQADKHRSDRQFNIDEF